MKQARDIDHWRSAKLGEFFRVKHGYAFKSTFFASEGSQIVLTPGNFKEDGGLKSQGSKEKFYSTKPPPDFVLRRGDLLVVMTDLTQEARILGSPAFIPEDGRFLHNQRLGKVVELNEEELNQGYLYYIFNWLDVRNQLKATATGATVRHTAPDRIYAVEIPLPPLPIQRRIAAILSTYDDLIENNTRRIAILEEMARRLYEEWFVHFRFPGHEGVKMIDSEIGPVPEGWEVKGLYDVAEVTYGHPFKSKQFNEAGNGEGVIRIRDIKAGRTATFTLEKGKSHHRVANGDLLIGMDGDFHMGKWSGGEAWLNQRVTRLRPRSRVSRYLLFLAVERPIKHLENAIVGTTVAHLSAKDMKAMRLALPPGELLGQTAKILEPMFDLELSLKRKNANLRAQRDFLLPKLISGEVDVSEFGETTVEVAAE